MYLFGWFSCAQNEFSMLGKKNTNSMVIYLVEWSSHSNPQISRKVRPNNWTKCVRLQLHTIQMLCTLIQALWNYPYVEWGEGWQGAGVVSECTSPCYTPAALHVPMYQQFWYKLNQTITRTHTHVVSSVNVCVWVRVLVSAKLTIIKYVRQFIESYQWQR